jgi:prepilin-type N-terminal cleavage/methylation domain-containing protein
MTRFGTARTQAGFTLIEMLAVIAIISTLTAVLLPAVQRVNELTNTMDESPRLKGLVADLQSMGDGSVRVQTDVVQLQTDSVNGGSDASLNAGDLATLCADLDANSHSVTTAQTDIDALLALRNLPDRQRTLVLNAQIAVGAIKDANALVKASVPGQCAAGTRG